MRTINPISFAITALNKSEKESLAYLGNNNSAFARELQNDCKLIRKLARQGYYPCDDKMNDQHNTEISFTKYENESEIIIEEFANQESGNCASAFFKAYQLAAELADLC